MTVAPERTVCLDSTETLVDGVSALVIELSVSGGAPPTEIRMFQAGVTDTTKGKFLFDDASAQRVMKRFAEMGKDRLPFDYGHGMVSFKGEERAAGWFVPAVRAGELWATDIQWTPRATRELSEREWRFYSPAFRALYSDDPAEPALITELINCALTNLPATIGQKPIVASEKPIEQRETMNPILKLLGVAGENEAHTAVTQLLGLQLSVDALLKAYKLDSIAALGSFIATGQAQLETVQKERKTEKRNAEIAALSAEGRLAPAQHDFVRTLSDDQFGEYTKTLPSARSETLSVTPSVTGSGPERKTAPVNVSLTAEELELAGMFGQDTDDMKAVKTELLSGSHPQRFTPRVKKSA